MSAVRGFFECKVCKSICDLAECSKCKDRVWLCRYEGKVYDVVTFDPHLCEVGELCPDVSGCNNGANF